MGREVIGSNPSRSLIITMNDSIKSEQEITWGSQNQMYRWNQERCYRATFSKLKNKNHSLTEVEDAG